MTGIQKATKNFSPNLKIGQGGFGTVYKGKLDDGMVVAIKRARKVRENRWNRIVYFTIVVLSKNVG